MKFWPILGVVSALAAASLSGNKGLPHPDPRRTDGSPGHRVIEALERLMNGPTVLTIDHRLSTIRDADKIIVLKPGGVAEQGTHDQLLALGVTYARLYSVQFDTTAAKAAP